MNGVKMGTGGLVVPKRLDHDLQELLTMTRKRERERAFAIYALLAEHHCLNLLRFVLHDGVKGLYAGMSHLNIGFSSTPEMTEVERGLAKLEETYK